MSVLIAFGTVEGQTGKIARFIESIALENNRDVQLIDTSDSNTDIDLEPVDTVILAAPVHERRHPDLFEAFVASEEKALVERRTLMISVSLSAAFPEGQEEAQDYLDEMKMRTELDPDVELLVAGAVHSRHYGYYETQVLKHIVLRGRSFEPSTLEHEFTDWEALGNCVVEFLAGSVPEKQKSMP